MNKCVCQIPKHPTTILCKGYNILGQSGHIKLFPRTCGLCWETTAFEVNVHPIVSLRWWLAPLSQQRNGLGGTGVLLRVCVGGLEVVLLVSSSGKTADYGS